MFRAWPDRRVELRFLGATIDPLSRPVLAISAIGLSPCPRQRGCRGVKLV
jgi:hypothetical protein